MMLDNKTIAVIGLGYVGLPLAVAFGRKRRVIGFDINQDRVEQLKLSIDHTKECSSEELVASKYLEFSCDRALLAEAEIFIVTVPTPVDKSNQPDMTLLERASSMVGQALSENGVVIYESTVYPGATEEVCVPILESESDLTFNKGFYCGYSPERINPGDKKNRLESIVKVTSGSTPGIAKEIDCLYGEIIEAGTYLAASIKVAEAAKVIENTQRDVNISLMNELSLIFNRLGIDTLDVLAAAETKWNFLPFRPGLVGGHCIGVDPYYLAYKAQSVGYHPEVILAGRRVNTNMATYVAEHTVKLMLKKGIGVLGARILVLGLTFKENCPDVRNTKVVDIINHLATYNVKVDVYDPWLDVNEVRLEYGIECLEKAPDRAQYGAVILAVGHQEFLDVGVDGIKSFGVPGAVLFDVKGLLSVDDSDARL